MSETKNKSNKRKKEKVEFTAENIDNTAPVKKILDELQHKNGQAYMFYSRNIKQRRTTQQALQNYHCVVPGYPLNSFDDDWDGELNVDYFEPFCYKSLCPKMISTLRNIEKADPVTSYIKYKLEWQRTCRNLKLTASFAKMVQKCESLNDEVVQCPKHIVDMAAHLDSDPDPYFDSPYNWYYAGNGNLQLVCIDWTDYLLHSDFSTVYLSEFNKNELLINSDHAASFDCGKDVNILETICSTHNIVVLRTKYKIFILNVITESCKMRFETIKCVESNCPYTGISFDDYHKNILYITTLDYKLSIVNLDRIKARSVKLKGKFTMLDNWSTVIGSGRGFYTHVGRKSISIYDKRSNNTVFIWKELRNMTDEISCNDISVAKIIGETSLYFGTNHHLFLMDIRNINQNDMPKVVRRWTHGMESVPTYISHANFEMNKELLVLSSQWCEDMCVLPNCSEIMKDTSSGGVAIPYRPPNILNTFDEARQKMLCNDLYNPIDTRLCTAITGALIMERGEKYDILMQNALGDVSCHTLFPEYMDTFVDNDGPDNLHDWSTAFKMPTKEFEVSSIENIASIWKQLKKVPEDFLVGSELLEGKSPFNEAEIFEAFENEEIDSGLQEVWVKGHNELVGDQSSLALNLYISDDEK